MSWMHLRSTWRKIDFFIFSALKHQSQKTVIEICEMWNPMNVEIEKIPADHAVVFSGHGGGSGFALCANKYAKDLNNPNQRLVIVSGVLVSDAETIVEMEPDLKDTSIIFLSGQERIPDISQLSNRGRGFTFPQFGYSCEIDVDYNNVMCTNPQPTLDIDFALKRTFSADPGEVLLFNYVLLQIHSFDYYRRCFYACYSVFEENGFTFEVNVPGFAKDVIIEGASPGAALQEPYIIPHSAESTPNRKFRSDSLSAPLQEPATIHQSAESTPNRQSRPGLLPDDVDAPHLLHPNVAYAVDSSTSRSSSFDELSPNTARRLEIIASRMVQRDFQRYASQADTLQRPLSREGSSSRSELSNQPNSSDESTNSFRTASSPSHR